MMKKIKIAVAGCGDIAHIRYFYALERLPELFELIGVHDYEPEVLAAVSEEFHVPGYGQLEELLAVPELDTLIVTTYHPSHAGIAVAAMNAGKNVIIEKPFATSAADARLVRETAQRTGRLCMALPFEIYPAFSEARKMIEDGLIGKPASADGIFAHQGPLHAPWFFNKELASWGVLADLGIYPIAILSYLLGPIKTVSGKVENLTKNRTSLKGEPIDSGVEDNVAAVLEWEHGAVATGRSNGCTAADKNGCIYSINIYGDRGIIYINMLTHELIVYSPYTPIENGERISYLGFDESYRIALPEYDDHLDILKAFYEAHETGIIPEGGCDIDRQVNIIEAIEKLYEASATGYKMDVY